MSWPHLNTLSKPRQESRPHATGRPHSPAPGPYGLPDAPTVSRVGIVFCPPVPLPQHRPGSQEAADGLIQGLAHGSSRGGARLIPDPQDGESFVFCLSVQTLLKSAGVARGPGWPGSL